MEAEGTAIAENYAVNFNEMLNASTTAAIVAVVESPQIFETSTSRLSARREEVLPTPGLDHGHGLPERGVRFSRVQNEIISRRLTVGDEEIVPRATARLVRRVRPGAE